MANTIVQLHTLPSLGSLTLKLYPRTGGAIVNGASGDALTESGSTPGLYSATVTESLAGIYAARVSSGPSPSGGPPRSTRRVGSPAVSESMTRISFIASLFR